MFGPFTWAEWLELADGIADAEMPKPTVRLSEPPKLLHYAQGDATVYWFRNGGKSWLIHDKAYVPFDEILVGCLRNEWPTVAFVWDG